ncbi:MAG: hypothetical protein WC655_28335 [Candidatus Hydrogenedentales bacterium]|jgi:hypothetical protein
MIKPSNILSKKGAGSFCSCECKAAWMSSTTLTVSGAVRNKGRRAKGGKRADLGDRYFRSGWEANWARYLNWLEERGEIARWQYEPDTFEFPVKRGSKFYTPDFKVFSADGSFVYHEIKGWMSPESATKLRRMALHHPNVTVELKQIKEYTAIAKALSKIIPCWE